MSRSVEQLASAALNLSPEEREWLIEMLMTSLEADPDYEEEWARELERRHRLYEAGEMTAVPAKEVIDRLRKSLREEPSSDVERAWDAEISRRAAELRAGTVETIPAEQVFEEIDELLKDDE